MHRFCCACLKQNRADPHEAYFHPGQNQGNRVPGDRVGIPQVDPVGRNDQLRTADGQVAPAQLRQQQLNLLGHQYSGLQTPTREEARNHVESILESDRMQILSAVKEKDVQYLDKTPSDDEDLITHPFECPICYRFSDHILRTHCCRQYICHTCAVRLKSGFVRSSCPHCRTQPLVLVDPTPTDPVRCYRDSPTKVGRKIEWMNIATTAVAKEGKGPAAKKLNMPQNEQRDPHHQPLRRAGGA